MIVNAEIVDYKKKKTGKLTPVYKYSLNTDFWKGIIENEPNGINVVIDEAHSILNARRSMSKVNIIITDWIALIRRVLGGAESGHGTLTLISQLSNRIDIIAREMTTQIIYTICHYSKVCKKCNTMWNENSEMPEGFEICPKCKSWQLRKFNHILEIWHFPNMQYFYMWKEFNQKSFYKHYYVLDIEKYFPLYNTLQWDNLFSKLYA